MISKSALAACWLIIGWAEVSVATEKADATHTWKTISYPEISCRFGNGKASPSLSVSDQPGKEGLGLFLGFWWPKAAESNAGFVAPDGKLIRLRLHHADGTVASPSYSNFSAPFARGSHMGRDWHGTFHCVFPWIGNQMQEAWLEVTFPDQTYWLEVPYGFTRDPAVAQLPESKLGLPKIAPAMKPLPARAQMVRWKDVFYSVGAVENDFWVSLHQSNLQNARSLINLGREVTRRWDVNSPRTSVEVRQKDGTVLSGQTKGSHLRESGSYRIDEFFLETHHSDETRDWARITVTVGEHQWSLITPSSLYKPGHGSVDPER